MLPQPQSRPIRVVIVDDHPLVSEGMRSLLSVQPDINVVGVTRMGAAALQLVREQRATVLLLDLRLPDISGVVVATQVRKEQPETAILVLTAYEDDECLRSLLTLGIQGYLLKTAAGEEVVAAVQAVAQGRSVFARQLHYPCQEYERSNLTERETEVLRLLLTGHRNREIAETLYVSVKTIEFHISHIFEKLGVRSRTEALRKVILEGLIVSHNA